MTVGQQALAHGRQPIETKRDRPLRVAGVGHGSQEALHNCTIPICLMQTDGVVNSGTFEAPTIRHSQLPGLLGLSALEDTGAIIDFKRKRLYFPGPGDHNLESTLPPGTEAYQLDKAPSGHLLLPCTHYAAADKQQMGGIKREREPRLALLSAKQEDSPSGSADARMGSSQSKSSDINS